ncbi:MAG: hypothetical protein HYS52_01545 [Candidatus Wildermuthbacteria bacterium]|nr:hypothetical protein [Candidatus Wildermuthbacteria bacterium]
MKFRISLEKENLLSFMRKAGYAPEGKTPQEEFTFHRSMGGAFPRFHAYCVVSKDLKFADINLHLDQKAPSYKGTPAHGGEYEGVVVENEVRRITQKSQPLETGNSS